MREFREWGLTAAPGAVHAMFGGTFGDARPYQVSFVLPAVGAFAPVAHPTPVPFPPVGTFDSFPGTAGNDHLTGTAGDDDFDVSQGGNDTVEGNDGNDYVYFGAAFGKKDRVDGGANTLISSNGDTVELQGDYSAGLKIGASTLSNVEDVFMDGADQGGGGGSYSIKLNDASVAAGGYMFWDGFQFSTGTDHFDLDGSAETDGDLSLQAYGRGTDHLTGGGGNDFVNGGVSGNDVLDGGGGWNRVSFSRAVTGASGGVTVSLALQGSAQDVGGGRMVTLKHFQGLSGSAHNDILSGDKNANYIATNGGSDTVHGARGDDGIAVNGFVIGVLTYAVTATGDAGNDTLAFTSTRGGVTFSLDLQGTAQSVGADGTVNSSDFENAGGTSAFGDTLTGDSAANNLYGDGGNDTLRGGSGNDHLYGDKAFGLIATDIVTVGASGLGSFDRGSGDDFLQGGAGDDLLDGGVGIDTADYSDATGSVHVDLNILVAQDVGGALGFDTLVSIEVLNGSDFGDTLLGDGNANSLIGGAGGDTLTGGNASDLLDGGAGGDVLSGGDDDDYLVGGADTDTLNGDAGSDIIYGDAPEHLVATGFQIVSTADDGTTGDSSSSLGRFSLDATKMVFTSRSDNLDGSDPNPFADIFVKDLVSGDVTRITGAPSGNLPDTDSNDPSFSPDGTKIVFQARTPTIGADPLKIYVGDLTTGTVTLVSTNADGDPAGSDSEGGVFLPDGDHVLFSSLASNLIDGVSGGIFIKDLTTGEVTLVSTNAEGDPANGAGYFGELSADGTKVMFYTYADNLVDGDTNGFADIYVKDLVTGDVVRVSTASDGTEGNGSSFGVGSFSRDGTKVVFASSATNLVDGVQNPDGQLYMKDLVSGETTCFTKSTDGAFGDASCFNPLFSPDGHTVAYLSNSDNLVAGDTNGVTDLFVTDLLSGVTARITDGPDFGDFDYTTWFDYSADGSEMLISTFADSLPGANGQLQEYVVSLGFLSEAGGNDTLNGGKGDDILIGGAGADSMKGGSGADTFQYGAVDDSTGTGFDTVIAFDANEDRFSFSTIIAAVDATVAAGSLSDGTFNADLAAAVDAAHLGARHAVLFTPDSGNLSGKTFLIVDQNGVGGYQTGEDIVVRLDSAVNLASLGVEDFI